MRRALLVVLASLPAYADDAPAPAPAPPPPPTPFDRGKVALSVGGGTTSTLGHSYVVIGGLVGYYVLDGVLVAVHGVEQFGSGPNISELSPELRYVAQPLVGKSPIIPYVGGFYNHWFIGDGLPDVDSVGARAGGLFVSGNVVLGLGVVYEHIVSDCMTDCDSYYPDITIALSL
jgi:hypothetical protein